MKKLWFLSGALIGSAALLILVGPTPAQFRLPDWLGGRSAPPQQAPALPMVGLDETGRLTEILIQLAWLGDPATFPYFLEARVGERTVEVRGYVPSKEVREKAL